jgi:hypothetical protein
MTPLTSFGGLKRGATARAWRILMGLIGSSSRFGSWRMRLRRKRERSELFTNFASLCFALRMLAVPCAVEGAAAAAAGLWEQLGVTRDMYPFSYRHPVSNITMRSLIRGRTQLEPCSPSSGCCGSLPHRSLAEISHEGMLTLLRLAKSAGARPAFSQ